MESLSINSVSFSRWSPASILQSSVIAVEKEADLSSPLLGVVFGGKCATCCQTKHACPGHFGSIRLTEPVYHISWIQHLLRKLKKCKGKFQWDKHKASILKDRELFPASECFLLFPDPPVISVLPVPPPHVRPPLIVDGELKGENDLTYRLQNVLRKNRHLEKVIRCKRPKEIVDQAREGLQNAVTGYINHEKLGPTRRMRNKREYASLESRIIRKQGRVRSNLMGKRANFTARCVITGDDSLKLTEVGIPRSVARTLTIPVKVTDYTKEALQDMVTEDKVKYVTKKDGSRSSKKVYLEVGDTVERYLVDGDIVLFNRQPSLHKYSLMAHHVRILPYSSIRMNVACTSPYNADFDGDEMNLHVPQTLMARAEAEEIMQVKHNIITAQGNCPVIGLIQDALLGSYLLSGETSLKRHEAMQIAQCPTGLTGKEIISTILPPLTYTKGEVEIVQGNFLRGRLTKKHVGKSNGSLVHVIYNDYGADACVNFMHNLQGLAHRYLRVRGFTIGLGDLMRSKEATVICREEREKAFEEAKLLEDPNMRLNSCRNIMGRAVVDGMTDSNNFFAMINSGSKGSLVNLTQVQACLGQMNVQGGRIPKQWRDRTATCFPEGENGPLSRGFVAHSYLEGLSPVEMFNHSMSGREGLIDTAIKTAQTGYTERKLMKCLENVVVKEQGVVFDGEKVVSFLYGEDGFDASKIESQPVKPLPGARPEDLAMLTEKTYHFPVPIHRIARQMTFYGSVVPICGTPVVLSTQNPLLQAFINVHTPTMDAQLQKLYVREIEKYLAKACICEGECVGALAAQSIGERTTQCTLNSVDYKEWLVIRGHPTSACIGKIIDDIMKSGYEEKNGSHIAEVSGLEAYTVDHNGRVSWKEITHVTRHPPRHHKGSNKLVKMTLESGRTLVASRAKSFLVLQNAQITPIDGADLKIGMEVPVLLYSTGEKRGFDELGTFLGAFYACGKVRGGGILFPESVFKSFKLRRFNMTITKEDDNVKIMCERLYYMVSKLGQFPNMMFSASAESRLEFCKTYMTLRGTYNEGFLCTPCRRYLRDGIAFMLGGMGIVSTLSPMGIMLDPANVSKLDDSPTEYAGANFERITNIESVGSTTKYVYDLTVKDTKNMCALNGIACRDTFHFAGIGSKNVTLGIPRLQEILGVSKNPKTPLTTVKDKKALELKYDRIADILLEEDGSIENYWDFPDGDMSREEVYAKWGEPQRLVLQSDLSILSMFEYAAYQEYKDKIVVDAFGEFESERGVKGAEWCKWINGRVETTLQDLHLIASVVDDATTLYTNNIYKMEKTFGIEAARTCLLIELRKILDHYGIYINARHLFVLIDAMTQNGKVTPLSRHGLKRSNCSALKRCTFEEVVKVLHEAALKEEVDSVDGVSPCILTGKVANIGGQRCTVLKDLETESKYQQTRPQDMDGVDMWMPLPSFVSDSPKAFVEDNEFKRRGVFVESKSPKYSAHSPRYAPQSPLYAP